MSYTEQITKELIEAYEESPTRETVEELANTYGKSIKSIIGKLSREGVYRREVYRSKTGELPITKEEIVNNIANALGIEPENLVGLEKSPKTVLQRLEKAIAGSQQIREQQVSAGSQQIREQQVSAGSQQV